MPQTIGEKIRLVRKERGLTQKELGERSGIAEPTIRRYELGKLNPKIETLMKIASALGVTVWELGAVDSPQYRQAAIHNLAQMYEDDAKENKKLELLKRAFYKLNPDGQDKALERVQELTEIPRYQNPDREKEHVKVWCGPSIPNGTQQYTQIHGALSDDMKAFLNAHPHADCLLVPLKEESAVRVMLEHEYADGEPRPEEKIQYDRLKRELYSAGDSPEDTASKKD
ncbi:MAG: helix-turn-helix domain-containing protein [Faecalibacterium sp.]